MAIGTHAREQTLKHLGALCQTADRLHQASVNQTTDVRRSFFAVLFHQHHLASTCRYLTILVSYR